MYDKIVNDIKEAMKTKDKVKLSVLRMVKASCDKERIDNKKEMTDEIVLDVLVKQKKMLEDSISSFEKAKRDDLVLQSQKEKAILDEYLPKPLTNSQLEEMIEEVFLEVAPQGMKDMGKVMALLTPKIKGRIDMSIASNLVKEKLS